MFKAFVAPILLYAWLSSIIAALPTVEVQSLSLSLEDISLQLNTSRVNPLNASQIIHYSIPQTQIQIIIYTSTAISGLAMRHTLEACRSAANAAMGKHGNVYMFPDPCICPVSPLLKTGLEIQAESTMVPGLKWVDLIHAIIGIEQITSQRALYKSMHVKIVDEPSGMQMGFMDIDTSSTITLVDDRGGSS